MNPGWIWLSLGAVLMILEIMAPGFVIFFFGLAAATVGLVWFAVGSAFDLTWQIASFSLLSIAYILVLRRFAKSIFLGDTESKRTGLESEYVGRIGEVTTMIVPPFAGRVMLGDAEWNAASDSPIPAGTRVRVVSQRNLTFTVTPI